MSYKKTMEGVRYLVLNELDMATETNGGRFRSYHEAYAVILEEKEELRDELWEIFYYLDDYWESVKNDKPDRVALVEIEKHAMMAACEAIQVAAMARKAM